MVNLKNQNSNFLGNLESFFPYHVHKKKYFEFSIRWNKLVTLSVAFEQRKCKPLKFLKFYESGFIFSDKIVSRVDIINWATVSVRIWYGRLIHLLLSSKLCVLGINRGLQIIKNHVIVATTCCNNVAPSLLTTKYYLRFALSTMLLCHSHLPVKILSQTLGIRCFVRKKVLKDLTDAMYRC